MEKKGHELVFLHSGGGFLRQNPAGVSDHINDNVIDGSKPMIKEVDFFSSDRTSNKLPGNDQETEINNGLLSSSRADSGVNVKFLALYLLFFIDHFLSCQL